MSKCCGAGADLSTMGLRVEAPSRRLVPSGVTAAALPNGGPEARMSGYGIDLLYCALNIPLIMVLHLPVPRAPLLLPPSALAGGFTSPSSGRCIMSSIEARMGGGSRPDHTTPTCLQRKNCRSDRDVVEKSGGPSRFEAARGWVITVASMAAGRCGLAICRGSRTSPVRAASAEFPVASGFSW